MTSRSLLAVLLLALTSAIGCTVERTPPPVAVPAANGTVLFEERFDGPGLDTAVWNTCHWWDDGGCTIASNHELEWYLPGQVSVRDGALHLRAERLVTTAPDGRVFPFRSGMVSTGPPRYREPARFAFTYGSVEVRLRTPAGQGLWPAVWLLPAESRSRPEIDILEVLGHDPGLLRMHLHPADRSRDSQGADHRLDGGATFADGWHDVRLDWQPGELRFSVDGQQAWTVRGKDVPDEPMYLVMNLAVGGDYPGPPAPGTVFPAEFAIDHVVIRGPGG